MIASARRSAAVVLLSALAAAGPMAAAKITLEVLDGPNEGFNDPTPVSAVLGNPGRTLGDQRRNAFRAAAREWESRLASAVEIVVSAGWESQDCTPTRGTLASAGPTRIVRDFPEAPQRNTWYVLALANALAGESLSEVVPIDMAFNVDVGTPQCLSTLSWDYRIGATSASFRSVGFTDTVMHELGHGLGFVSLVDLETGEEVSGFTDAFSQFLRDGELGRNWPRLSDAQRLESARRDGQLFWDGGNVNLQSHVLRDGVEPQARRPLMYAPTEINEGSSVSHFDVSLDSNSDELMEPFSTDFQEVLLTDRLFQDMGWGATYPKVRAISDVDGNGKDDLAVLRFGEELAGHRLVILDGRGGRELTRIDLPAEYSAIDLQTLPDFDGSRADEVAVLMWRARGRWIRVFVFDAGTGEQIREVRYAAGYAKSLLRLPSIGGTPVDDLAVAGSRTNGAPRIWIKDPMSGALVKTHALPRKFRLADLGLLSSFRGTGADELLLAVTDQGLDRGEVHVRDARSGERLAQILLPEGLLPQHVVGLADFGDTDAGEVAVLGLGALGQPELFLSDGRSAEGLRSYAFPETFVPVGLETMSDFGATPADELVVLGVLSSSQKGRTYVVDAASGEVISSKPLNSRDHPRTLAVLPSIGGSPAQDVAVVTFAIRDGRTRVRVWDGRGSLLKNWVVD